MTVIGVLTAILLPVARQSMPDENLMKFKKAHNTFGTVIRELVTSDRYYKDGDLGMRPNGDLIDGHHDGDTTYFCETFADMVTVKINNCQDYVTEMGTTMFIRPQLNIGESPNGVIKQTLEQAQENADEICKRITENISEPAIILNDGVSFFENYPINTFGISYQDNNNSYKTGEEEEANCVNGGVTAATCAKRMFSSPSETPTQQDVNGFDRMYRVFCLDIDDFKSGEDPFGYGVRADGKIVTGKRALEWLEREVNEE